MNHKLVEELVQLVDEIGTARVQRYVTNLQCPDDKLRQRAAQQRIDLLRQKLRDRLGAS